jgi:hypothetical protein
MNKFLTLILAFASTSFAAQIACGGSQSIVNPPNPGTFVCSSVSNPGLAFAITDIFISGSATFEDASSGGPFTFGISVSENSPQISLSTLTIINNALPGTVTFATNSQNLLAGVSLNEFTVTVLRNGSPLPSITTADVFLNFNIGPAAAVPEPGTVALLGSSLLGLVAFARRRK